MENRKSEAKCCLKLLKARRYIFHKTDNMKSLKRQVFLKPASTYEYFWFYVLLESHCHSAGVNSAPRVEYLITNFLVYLLVYKYLLT